MLNEVKTGFGRYLHGYFNSLTPTTKAMREFIARDFAKACFWGPGYQIDSVEDLLQKVRANDNSGAPGTSAQLPVVIATMARDMLPVIEWGQSLGGAEYVIVPEDPKARIFRLRQVSAEVRTQIAIISADEPTARSIGMQYVLWCSDHANRSFPVVNSFAGFQFEYRTMIETPDLFTNHILGEQSNLCMLTIDVNLRVTVPLLRAPSDDEPNDGRGTPGNPDDPSGYPVVTTVVTHEFHASDYRIIDQPQPGDPITVQHLIGTPPT